MQPILRFLRRYAVPNLPQYVLGLVMLFVTNYAIVRIPTLVGNALTLLEGGRPQAAEIGRSIALELMAWAVTVVVARTLSRVLFFNPGRTVEFRLGVDLFRKLLSLQSPFYLRRKVGELVSIATNDTSSVRLLIGFAGLQVCNVAVAIPLHIHQMWETDSVLTLWVLAPVSIGAVYMHRTVRMFYGMIRQSLELLAKLSDRILESYAGIGTSRAHVSEEAMVRRFDERNLAYLDLQLRIAKIRAFSMPALSFSGLVGAGLVLWIGGDRVISGQMEIGELATFTSLLLSLVGLLMALAWVLAAISRGIVSLGRIDAVVETPDELPAVEGSLNIQGPPALSLRDLNFTYPETEDPALQGLSLELGSGQTLGIFGRTGSGKTTLVNLLARVYTAPPGTILLDGQDITKVSLQEFRTHLAVVPQDPFLFSTTLRDNIRLKGERTGHARTRDAQESSRDSGVHAHTPKINDPMLDRVLAEACLVEDIDNLAEGLDTIVGERGVMLSGGQRQRTALARALYQAPPLLLLDDILSAVDQGTEARLVAAIRGLSDHADDSPPPTTVIVSHRTSVLEHADEILVLEQGKIVERGTHAELIAMGGHYADAHTHQRTETGDA